MRAALLALGLSTGAMAVGASPAFAATYHIGAGSACTGNGSGNTGNNTDSAWLIAITRNECRVRAVAHCTNGDWLGGWKGPTLGQTSSKQCGNSGLLLDSIGRWQTALYY